MGEGSKVEWCDDTFNIVHGCVKVSPACSNCYAKDQAERWGRKLWGPKAPRRVLSAAYWRQLAKWEREAASGDFVGVAGSGAPRLVFCCSMCDWAEDHPVVREELAKFWPLTKECPHLFFLMLSKRPEEWAKALPSDWGDGYPNVGLGVTAESAAYIERVWKLLSTPARFRFVSCEPLLGDLPLGQKECLCSAWSAGRPTIGNYLDWVIAGGESGPKARPTHPLWAARLQHECAATGTPFFWKQWGAFAPLCHYYDDDESRDDYLDAPHTLVIGSGETWRVCDRDGRILDGQPPPDTWIMRRYSKKAAGASLNGRTYREFPTFPTARGQLEIAG